LSFVIETSALSEASRLPYGLLAHLKVTKLPLVSPVAKARPRL